MHRVRGVWTPAFFCLDDVCTVCAANAPAPTTSLISLAMGTAFLLGIAALAIWQRRRETEKLLVVRLAARRCHYATVLR